MAIEKELTPVKILVMHAKRIINFFSTQKQIKRLKEEQHKLEYKDILYCI